ncbi:LacI family DNA-binding transcriptional regulator [Roseibium litorale]|uniref:LacI family DNA-binding transcriptional regulator n=1 Tax=Roseibium litorale TaxID=2803841 RepID=A0ABR9CPR0_9HYPH|nr:LacI family DNA-binding transcriptional regulator [Roseibium litorale]MBD8892659.1 LacI family DNA-binding transcriptional regulator [Roseibium litorale]
MTQSDDPSGAGRKRNQRGVTMEAVGRIAGVSQVTVSRALSDPSKVSPQTMARIRDAIAVTGFVPNALAGALVSRKSMMVSALVPSITNIIYASMLAPFSSELKSRGYQILLSETGLDPDEEAAVVEAHLSRRPDAIWLTGVHHAARTRRMLIGASIPVVETWDMTETPIDLCVGFSHAASGRAVAEFAREAGYTKGAGISAGDERAQRRLGAFASRFRELSGCNIPVVTASYGSIAAGRAMLAELLDRRGFSGGLVACSSDVLAQGVLIEAAARGIAVPTDLAVVGFGDQELAETVEPGLTTIRVNRDAMGRIAAQALLARIGGETPPRDVIDVGFTLIRRASA